MAREIRIAMVMVGTTYNASSCPVRRHLQTRLSELAEQRFRSKSLSRHEITLFKEYAALL